MSILLSDGIGAIAGLFLAIPPLRDQYGRFRERTHTRRCSMSKIHGLLRTSLKEKREVFNGYDSLFLAAGSFGLVAAFLLKNWDL